MLHVVGVDEVIRWNPASRVPARVRQQVFPTLICGYATTFPLCMSSPKETRGNYPERFEFIPGSLAEGTFIPGCEKLDKLVDDFAKGMEDIGAADQLVRKGILVFMTGIGVGVTNLFGVGPICTALCFVLAHATPVSSARKAQRFFFYRPYSRPYNNVNVVVRQPSVRPKHETSAGRVRAATYFILSRGLNPIV